MAVDVALARCLEPAEGVLRIYSWSHPTLSLGRNQPAWKRYGEVVSGRLEGRVVRRPTGGREVLHDRELTYAVVARDRALGGPRATFEVINRALVVALQALGVPAELARSEGRVPALGAGACFNRPVENEIQARGQKIVGSAQARIGRTLLQHGSLPLLPGPELVPGLRYGGGSVAELLGQQVRFTVVADSIETAMAEALPGEWRRGRLRPREQRVAASLLAHYESPAWTWRR